MTKENFENETVIFPEPLTEVDKKLIIEQCENQNATSKEQIEGFANAYHMVKELASDSTWLESLDANVIYDLILTLAKIIEEVNTNGFRKVEIVSFQAAKAENIVHLIGKFCEIYTESKLTSEELYKVFEEIHPFLDGNGRLGDLLWKLDTKRKTGIWPETLPPEVFHTDNASIKRESAFGEIED